MLPLSRDQQSCAMDVASRRNAAAEVQQRRGGNLESSSMPWIRLFYLLRRRGNTDKAQRTWDLESWTRRLPTRRANWKATALSTGSWIPAAGMAFYPRYTPIDCCIMPGR